MPTITTREIVDRAAALAGVHDNFVTPAQWMYWATQEQLALSLFLARAGWTQNVTSQTFTVAGSEAGAFNLSVHPLAIVAAYQVKSNQVRILKLNNFPDFLRQVPGSSNATGDPHEYRVIWDQANDRLVLNFYPEPIIGTSIVVPYIAQPSRLSLDTSPAAGYVNSVKYPMGWEERIVLGMAENAKIRGEEDSSPIRTKIGVCEANIERAVYDIVLSQQATVRNLDGVTRGWKDRIEYPPFSDWYFS